MTQQNENLSFPTLGEEHHQSPDTLLLKKLKAASIKIVHGVIDFVVGVCLLGFNIQIKGSDDYELEKLYLIVENGNFRLERSTFPKLNDQDYVVNKSSNLPMLDENWGINNLMNFMENRCYPRNLFESVKKSLKRYIELPHPSQYGLLALWCIATYFTHLFPAFPFLFIFGPKGTGKSKILELMSYITINGRKIAQTSEAALCDATDGMRSTIFIDQAEYLARDLIGLLADSYKKVGAKRWVIDRKNGNRNVKEISGYGPKCFAATSLPDHDLSDRGPILTTIKSRKKLPDLIGNDDEFKTLRDGCYRFLLLEYENVKKIFESLTADGTRGSELWRPLEAVAIALNISQTELTNIKDIFEQTYAKSMAHPSVLDLALFEILNEYLQAAETKDKEEDRELFEKTPGEIIKDMKPLIDKNSIPKPQWVGKRLALYSLINKHHKKKISRKKLMHYSFKTAHVKNIIGRYLDIE